MKELLMAAGPMPGWASYSAIGSFRACPQRWNYAYLHKLSKPVDAADAKVELQFGIWWHALRAAQAIETGRERESLLICPRTIETPAGDIDAMEGAPQTLPQRVSVMAGQWYDGLSEDHKAQWLDRLGDTLPNRLWQLDRRWRIQYADDDNHEDPVGVEVKWTRTLPSGVELLGYIDLIYRDRKRGLIAARDYKSMKKLDSQTTVDDMMDSQLQLYAWGVTPQLAPAGLRLSALSYDRACSVKATEPKITQMGGLSKSVTNYDWLTYVEWAALGQTFPGRTKDGSQAGVYEEDPDVTAHLKTPVQVSKWFQRTLTPLNRHLILSHLRAAEDTVADMERTVATIERRGDAPRNLGKDNCRWCDFASLCRAQMVGGPEGEYPLENFGLVARS